MLTANMFHHSVEGSTCLRVVTCTYSWQPKFASVSSGAWPMCDVLRSSSENKQLNQLAAQMFPMRHFPVVEEFVSLFDGTRHHRRPILAIVGGSNLGKSLLAGKILQRVGRSLGIEEFLEITVEGSDFLDLTGYDHRMHCGVVAVMAYLCV